MQDSSNACNLNAYIGYISFSLVCRDTDHKKTTCFNLVDTMKPQFTDIQWKKSAKYVTVDERIVQNFNPILKEEATSKFGMKFVNEIQNITEIKDGNLYDSQSNIQSKTLAKILVQNFDVFYTSELLFRPTINMPISDSLVIATWYPIFGFPWNSIQGGGRR